VCGVCNRNHNSREKTAARFHVTPSITFWLGQALWAFFWAKLVCGNTGCWHNHTVWVSIC
jgi:hypothetical protein